jgi:hypothetical protein
VFADHLHHSDPGTDQEVKTLPNPFAIGVTLGGLLLDLVAPRPKPRLGYAAEPSLLSLRPEARTPTRATVSEHDGAPIASGSRF